MNLKQIFKPHAKQSSDLLKISDLRKIIRKRMEVANTEFKLGYKIVEKYPRTVSILGSARFKPGDEYYTKAETLARRIATDLKYAVVTGGGPGIMEAANKGAFEAKGQSLGFGIKLPKEQDMNKYLTESLNFEYFFSRKTIIFFSAEAYVYFPGGFGTMDELFEVLTLMQTGEISKAPIILVGRDFWSPLMKIVEKEMLEDEQTISPEDKNLYSILDSEDEIIEIIKNAPIRQVD